MFNTSAPENVVDINSYLANPLPHAPKQMEEAAPAQGAAEALVQTNKRLVTIVMGMTLMIGLVACVAYLAGRAMTIARSNGNPQIRQTSPIIVDSPKVQMSRVVPQAQAPISKPAPNVAIPAAPAALPLKPVVSASVGDTPVPGQWYVQVGYVELEQLSTFRRGLEEKGFKSFAVSGDTADARRVLLGPVQDNEARLNMQHRLKAAGYESFQRRY